MKTLQKSALALAASSLLATAAFAQTAPAAEAPEASPITANVTVVNDYRYRGISQSNYKPAIQGGFDYAHESGLYIGNWNSSISWISDAASAGGNKNVSAPIEMDFYAGIKKELIGEGFASDLGVLQYYYPTSGLPSGATNPNTTEIYAAQNFTFGPITGFAKFSYAATTLFGFSNSAGSYYPDLTVNYDTGIWGLALNAHVGYQYVAGNVQGSKPAISNSSLYSYTDYKLGVTKDLGGGLSLAAAYITTNAGKTGSTYNYASPTNRNLGGSTGIVSLTKTF
ncbi:TorF family putative porin [Polynucleobacter sp. MWH-Berg-3C6]|uniref:TorF family putative porin n=1 Tax=Polynucleobacter sp. MWH-Berg-3C6 TaxID=1855882 RepID=UPI001C0B5E17|nr:TorF family putative porin [Polynucleobacter sp. MWH-Berg-3C6]MBU3551053.1 hypothetical protein [Polynucleobacter sp. MWH-Berg-3C6]